MTIEKNIQSPCINTCKLDENKICIGCRRTIDEISKWLYYSDTEKLEILERIYNEQFT